MNPHEGDPAPHGWTPEPPPDPPSEPQPPAEPTTAGRAWALIEEVEQRVREISGLEESLTADRRAIDDARTDLDHRERALGDREQAIAARAESLDALERRLNELRNEVNERSAEVDAARAALADRERELNDRAQAIDQQADQRARDEVASLTQRAERAEAEVAELRARAERAESQLAEARQQADRLARDTAQVAETNAALIERAEQAERTAREAADADRAVAESLRARIAELETQAAAAAGGRTDEWIDTRRARLAAVRGRLRDDRAKVDQAKHTITEQVQRLQHERKQVEMGKRVLQDIEKQREEVRRTEEAAQRAKADADRLLAVANAKRVRSASAWVAAAAMLTIAVVGAGSWFGAGLIEPPTYEASATLAMADDAPDLGADAVAGWSDFILALPDDPRFLEVASDRMRARGIDEWGTPAALGRGLDTSLEVTDDGDGRVSLAMIGEGSGRTERALANLSTSMLAYANDTRSLRADNAGTVISRPASVAGTPVHDDRLRPMAIVAGVGLALAGLIWFGAWGSLRRAVAGAAEDAAWSIDGPAPTTG